MSSPALLEGTLGASRKRKDRELSDPPRRLKRPAKSEPAKLGAATTAAASAAAGDKGSNLLLAGFLAHEFLTKGTLFGKRWESVRSGRAKGPAEPDRTEPDGRPSSAAAASSFASSPPPPSSSSYAEASYLVMRGGTHVDGVFNPTQLARWLQS